MEELLEVNKKQLLFQKIITGCLMAMVVIQVTVGLIFVSQVKQMTTALNDASEKIQQIDVEGINDAISSTDAMMDSVDEFSAAVDTVTDRVKDFDGWMDGIFGE